MDHVEPEESFMWDAYVEEVLGQENACTSIKQWGGGFRCKIRKVRLNKSHKKSIQEHTRRSIEQTSQVTTEF